MLAGLAMGSFLLRPKKAPKEAQDAFVLSYVYESGCVQHLIICTTGIPLESFYYKPDPGRCFPSVLALLTASPFLDQHVLKPGFHADSSPVLSRTASSASSRRSTSFGSGSTQVPKWILPPDCQFHFFLSHQQRDAGNTMSAL
jgi:hypothetical protein